jgi:hypothetical protein
VSSSSKNGREAAAAAIDCSIDQIVFGLSDVDRSYILNVRFFTPYIYKRRSARKIKDTKPTSSMNRPSYKNGKKYSLRPKKVYTTITFCSLTLLN